MEKSTGLLRDSRDLTVSRDYCVCVMTGYRRDTAWKFGKNPFSEFVLSLILGKK